MHMSDVANFFGDGKAYERLMGRWSLLAGEKFLDRLDAPKNLNWLDVGCGNGAFTEAPISRCSPTAVGRRAILAWPILQSFLLVRCK
jgi:hypothetical protein